MPKKRVFTSSRIKEVREFHAAAVKAIVEAGAPIKVCRSAGWAARPAIMMRGPDHAAGVVMSFRRTVSLFTAARTRYS